MYYDCLPCSGHNFYTGPGSSTMPASRQMLPMQQAGMMQQLPSQAGGFAQEFPVQQIGTQAPLFPAASIGTALPTGVPLGPSVLPFPVGFAGGAPTPTTIESIEYTPGFLRTQIGKKVRVEFLIGTGTLVDRSGTLVGVGTSYILLRPLESDDIMLCDMYSIKFVTIYQ